MSPLREAGRVPLAVLGIREDYKLEMNVTTQVKEMVGDKAPGICCVCVGSGLKNPRKCPRKQSALPQPQSTGYIPKI